MLTEKIDVKMFPFYIAEPPVTEEIETFFSQYASIPPSSLRNHLIQVRQDAWNKCNYPCLGRWSFLDFSIRSNPIFEEILDQCKNKGATLIDFGCCLGQNIRQLIHKGVPPKQLRGYDIDPSFIEQGYHLFADGETLRNKNVFHTGDIFDEQFLNIVEPADYVYVSSFIHLFDEKTQREVCRRLARLAKHAIAGREVGSTIAGEYPPLPELSGSKMMRHSPATFTEMWNEVSDGQCKVECANFQAYCEIPTFAQRLTFVIRKQSSN